MELVPGLYSCCNPWFRRGAGTLIGLALSNEIDEADLERFFYDWREDSQSTLSRKDETWLQRSKNVGLDSLPK